MVLHGEVPKVDADIFTNPGHFEELETSWASDLPMARWIWCASACVPAKFQNLHHLHLRSCPRLQFVLEAQTPSFRSLETLHIIHCGNLVHVFKLNKRYPGKTDTLGVLFPKLTTIHLHDLPKLQNICEVKMVAPALESIKIRGCWGLRRLPSVAADGQVDKKPTVEIEKDAWDALEWDDGHHPDHFEAPAHSRYYKKLPPRVSVLR